MRRNNITQSAANSLPKELQRLVIEIIHERDGEMYRFMNIKGIKGYDDDTGKRQAPVINHNLDV